MNHVGDRRVAEVVAEGGVTSATPTVAPKVAPFAVVEFEVTPRPDQTVLLAAVAVPMADRWAAVRRCCPFLTLLSPVRLAVPYTGDRVARRRSGFLPFPDVTRGFRRIQDVPPEVMSVLGDLV